MQFKAKKRVKYGSRRWKKRFAFVPVRMGTGYLFEHDGSLIWLESFYELQTFMFMPDSLIPSWTSLGGVVYTQTPWPLP